MKTELRGSLGQYVVHADGRAVYHSMNYYRAKAYAWNLIGRYPHMEIIVSMDGLIVGI